MDWNECKKSGLVRNVPVNVALADALLRASEKRKTAESLLVLSEITAVAKVSLSYEALRELLECLALLGGYKVYNHECFGAFLVEQVHDDRLAGRFNAFRIIRNEINYYGVDLVVEDARLILDDISVMIDKVKNLVFMQRKRYGL